MGPRFKIYGQLVLWIVGITIMTALIWNGLGMWMNHMEPGSAQNMRMGFTHPLAWLAYALPALLFGPMMWAPHTHRERIRLEPLNLPKPMAVINKFKFPLIIALSATVSFFIFDRQWGAAAGGAIMATFIFGMTWAASTSQNEDRKLYVARQSRKQLATRIDVAIDNYIKMMPPATSRARDKEFPFLDRIHHVNALALADDHLWNGNYMNYTAGTLRAVQLFMKELKIGLFREDIIWALLHAAQATLEPSERKYDRVAAEEAITKLEALVAP